MNTDSSPRELRGSGQGELWVLGQALLLASIFLAPLVFSGRSSGPDCVAAFAIILGIASIIVGCLLVSLSAAQLGPAFNVFPRPRNDGAFVQHGIYEQLRHPMYSGVTLVALGWSLFWLNVPAIILTVILGVFFDRKARREEEWLEQKYPDYTAYRERVRRRFPWVS
jgi:protein-S-isoprenylcysteine O-methyltransferase Ste14